MAELYEKNDPEKNASILLKQMTGAFNLPLPRKPLPAGKPSNVRAPFARAKGKPSGHRLRSPSGKGHRPSKSFLSDY